MKNAPHNNAQFVDGIDDVIPPCKSTLCTGDAKWAVKGDRILDDAKDHLSFGYTKPEDVEEFYCGRHLSFGIKAANWHSGQTVEVRELV